MYNTRINVYNRYNFKIIPIKIKLSLKVGTLLYKTFS